MEAARQAYPSDVVEALRNRVRVGSATILVAAAVVAATAATASAQFRPGAAGLGDPFFPEAGNGGYDVSDYDLALSYRPGRRVLGGRVLLTATATQDLSAFDLDFRGPRIRSLEVNGDPARYKRRGQELVITPPAGIADGAGLPSRSPTGVAPVSSAIRTAPRTAGSPPTTAPRWSASRRAPGVVSVQ